MFQTEFLIAQGWIRRHNSLISMEENYVNISFSFNILKISFDPVINKCFLLFTTNLF